MCWRRISFLLLLAACWLAPPRVGTNPTRRPQGFPAFRRVAAAPRPGAMVESDSRKAAVSTFAPWRYRLKSVRVDGAPRIPRAIDRGPSPAPDLDGPMILATRSADHFPSKIPLRC